MSVVFLFATPMLAIPVHIHFPDWWFINETTITYHTPLYVNSKGWKPFAILIICTVLIAKSSDKIEKYTLRSWDIKLLIELPVVFRIISGLASCYNFYSVQITRSLFSWFYSQICIFWLHCNFYTFLLVSWI